MGILTERMSIHDVVIGQVPSSKIQINMVSLFADILSDPFKITFAINYIESSLVTVLRFDCRLYSVVCTATPPGFKYLSDS